ncbi:MAG: 3-phosphoglycerate dehydrogenase [Deltaproteobacteria bacterium]|nr:3-phosphoglycerate dehydrogenase [Deltaproteobacteria bacterium]
MSKIVLLATEKPFAQVAVNEIEEIFNTAGYELIKLENYTDPKELIQAVRNVDAMIIRSDKANADVINASEKLKIIVRAGAGYDNIDLDASTAKGICAMNTPGQNSNAVAELAFGMMLFLARKKFVQGSGTELRGKTLGIHAYGNVGRFVAMIARGFGMKIVAFDPYVPREKMEAEGIEVAETVEDLYMNSDYVSLHIPANSETRESINYSLLSRMKNGGCLINTARKEVINESDLVKIMTERTDLMYATDVAPTNHTEMNEKFAQRYHATAKKMGAQTAEANINAGAAAARQIVNFFVNNDTTFQVNK